ncbi:MAG: hypothetical protein IPJ85_18320 [Flavobacteriales bacterium]|nr:hypothetical protein [Flavobacteriales bacterium]
MLTSIPEESRTELCGQVFIATRFNVVYTEAHFSKDKSGNATRTEAWLSRRFELFEQVCLPSLIAQSDIAFEWLIFLSDGTPADYKERMERYRRQFRSWSRSVPRWEYVVGRFQAEVRERLKPSATHAITLRIDNDDAFHRGMVRRARAELRDQQDEIINFLRGIQCAIDQGIAVQVSEKSNPFIVRIERIRLEVTVRTVMDVMHHEAAQSGLLRDVDTEPMWLQAIHGEQRDQCDRFRALPVLLQSSGWLRHALPVPHGSGQDIPRAAGHGGDTQADATRSALGPATTWLTCKAAAIGRGRREHVPGSR